MTSSTASIAQLGERKTEDLEALCSIHSRGIPFDFSSHQVTARVRKFTVCHRQQGRNSTTSSTGSQMQIANSRS